MKPKPSKTTLKKQQKPKPPDTKTANYKLAERTLSFFYGLILLGYSFITVLTPNLNTLDSNGPKFYTLAILNLVAYIIILTGNQLKPRQDFHWSFFRTWTGFVYTLFLMVSLLSFFKAFNIYESIINFSKLVTVFSASYIIAIILRIDKRYLYLVSISLALLLILDSLTVFYHIAINKMAFKDIDSISQIKSVYSNKNILTSALFVKISFVLWLLTFGKAWMKILGGFTLVLAFVAILLLSTRAFFVGSIFLLLAYGSFMIIRFKRKNEKRRIIFLAIYLSATVIIVFLSFSLAIKYIYPESVITLKSGYTTFIERLKTIPQSSGGGRFPIWQNSFRLIRANPLLGVGTGNWKVEVLKYETPTTGAFIYAYKNHNDFIETTADTGIIGGALFLGIFVLIFANFIKAFFKTKKGEEHSYSWLFLPAFGMFCYSFDAFFNFPSDRPEICSLFAIFVGAGIAFSPAMSLFNRSTFRDQSSALPETSNQQPATQNAKRKTRNAKRKTWNFSRVTTITAITIFLSLMIGSIYIFHLNFESLKLQTIAYHELNAGTLTSKAELFLDGFPAIPDINVQGEPIAVIKARYLDVEGRHQEVIDLLKKDNSSPWDTRREFFITQAYLKMDQPDSALVYANKVYRLKPFFSGNISLMSAAFEMKGDFTKALKVLDDHLQLINKNGMAVSDNIIYTQRDRLSRQCASLSPWAKTQQFQEIFSKAMASFDRKEYTNAIKYFSEIIDKEPGIAQAFEKRAFCYFYLQKYQLSLADITRAIALNSSKPLYFNFRGVNFHLLGNIPAACADFQTGIKMGDKEAAYNYDKYCK